MFRSTALIPAPLRTSASPSTQPQRRRPQTESPIRPSAGCVPTRAERDLHGRRDDGSAWVRRHRRDERAHRRQSRRLQHRRVNAAVFINPPLFDIQVRFHDGGSTETALVGRSSAPTRVPGSRLLRTRRTG